MIKDLNQNDNIDIIERLLSVNNFTEFSREYNNLITLNQKIKENITDVSNKKVELQTSKVQKEGEQQNLNDLKNNLIQKEQVVSITKKEKDTLLSQTKNKEAEYQKLLAEAEKRKDSFEKEMDDYENQLQLLINPKLLPKAGSEVLAWPLESILITSKFGVRINPFNSSIKTYHYGTDFRAQVGTNVKSVESGVVIGLGNTDTACKGASFGNWVLVKHNNGLSSTYAHLSVISVKMGQKLIKGDTIGLSGGMKSVFGSGSSTGPHLHLSVYASDGVEIASFESKACPGKILTQPRITRADAHLDPLLYLPKLTSEMVKK
jgi:murein DD-endopeptidase MepM/ murein hydrolase activator NlpD